MKRTWWQRFKASTAHTQANIVCTFIIMLATIAYALIAKWQLGAMKGQLEQMKGTSGQTTELLSLYRKQLEQLTNQATNTHTLAAAAHTQSADAEIFFRADERAWVEIEKIEKADTYPPSPPFATIFKYSFSVKNFGKTVARDVKIHIENIDQDGTFESKKRPIRMLQDSLFRDSKSGRRVIPPVKPSPQSIAPNGQFTVPVYSGGQEPRLIGGRYMYGFMLGRIDYVDAFDTQHWVRFCFMIMNAKGEVGHCQYGNEEDNNPEKLPTPR